MDMLKENQSDWDGSCNPHLFSARVLVESNLQDYKEREVLEQECEKNGDAVKVLKLEQVPKMKHFSIAVLVGGNGYFVVRPFVAQRWGPVSRLPFLCKHKRNTSALPPQAAFLA